MSQLVLEMFSFNTFKFIRIFIFLCTVAHKNRMQCLHFIMCCATVLASIHDVVVLAPSSMFFTM